MLVETLIRIEDTEAQFISDYEKLGFQSERELLTKALALLKKSLEQQQALEASAELYAEVFETDEETQDWTYDAVKSWQ